MNYLVPSAQQAIEGEILGPVVDKDYAVRIFIAAGPLRNERTKVYCPAGLTIRECIEWAKQATDSKYPTDAYRVYIGAHADMILPEVWDRVRPKPRSTLVLRPIAQGFLAALFAAIGSVFSALSVMGFIGKLIIGGILLGAKFLIGRLFAPKPKNLDRPVGKVSHSISGSRNNAEKYGPIPLILGSHRVSPPYAAVPYTERVGNEQWLRMVFAVGYGSLNIPLTEVRIGETPLTSFEDVEVEIRAGVVGDAPTTLYPLNVTEESLSIELLAVDSWHTRETADNVTGIQVEILWPRGLFWIDDDGNYQDMGSNIQWRYRLVGAVPWTQPAGIFLIKKTSDTQRWTLRATVAIGKYEVQVSKVGTDATSDRVIEDVHWIALRGIRTGEPITFTTPIAKIAVHIRGSSQLNNVIDTLNCLAESKVLAWNGTSWVTNTVSRNPANLFRYVLQCAANKQPVVDARIDLLALQDWWAYCELNAFTYDKPILTEFSVQDLIHEICVAGRANKVFKDGKWSVVWDEQNPPVVQMFSPRNSWGFEGEITYKKPPHAYRIPFVNRAKRFAEDERVVYDDGYTIANATEFEVIEFEGVTVSNTIWKHGRYHIAQQRLRPSIYTLYCDFEGLILVRNDRIYVQHDMLFVGLDSGRISAVGPGQSVTVSQVILLSPAESYQFRFRNADNPNSFTTRLVVPGTGGELSVFPLVGTGDLPIEGDLFTFGRLEQSDGVYRVIECEPQEDFVHKLTLVDDAPGISLADTGPIPDYDAGISEPVDPFTLPPTTLNITDGIYEEDGQFYSFLRASWTLPRLGKVAFFEVEHRNEATGTWITHERISYNTNFATFLRIDPGLYTVRVRNIFEDGTWSGWLTSPIYDASSINNPPEDVTNFSIAIVGEVSTLSWDNVPGAGISYQIRFAPIENPSPTWNTATPILSGIVGTSAQVQTVVGTFFIKAISPKGIFSVNAALILTSITSLVGVNVVEEIIEPTWTGNRTNIRIVDNELRLRTNNTLSTWGVLNTIISMSEGDGEAEGDGYAVEGEYTFPGDDAYIDLGEVYTPVRVTSIIDAYGFSDSAAMSNWTYLSDVATLSEDEPTDWEVQTYYQSTVDDPTVGPWTAWQLLTVSDVTMRAIRFKLILKGKLSGDPETEYAITTPAVRGVRVLIDMPDRSYGQNNLVCTVAGLDVTFVPAFAEIQGLGIAAQGLLPGDHYLITPAPTSTGFHIDFKNTAGSAIQRTFDFVAWGYGRISP